MNHTLPDQSLCLYEKYFQSLVSITMENLYIIKFQILFYIIYENVIRDPCPVKFLDFQNTQLK